MALGDLKIRIGIDATGIEKGLRNAQKKLSKSASRFAAIGSNISIGISAPLGLLGQQAISTAAEFETLETGLSVLTGSAEKGAAAFQRLKEFSAATPFQLNDLVKANNTMMGFGLTSDEAYNSLNQLGDIAAVMGSDLNSLSVAFGQSAASGVAMTADINQFINQGIPMYKLLEDVTGKTTKELKNMASKSQITFPLIQEALGKATKEGGMFFEGMAKGSQTIGGILSTFRDKLSLALGTLGKSIADAINFKEVMQKLGDTIGRVTKFFAGLSDGTKKIIIGVVGAIAVLGPLMFAMGSLTNVVVSAISGLRTLNAVLLANPFGLIALAVAAVVIGFQQLYKHSNQFRGAVNKLVGTIKNTFQKAFEAARQVIAALRTAFKSTRTETTKTKSVFKTIAEFIGKVVVGVLQKLADTMRFVVDLFIQLYNSSDKFRGVLFGIVAGVKTMIAETLAGLSKLGEAIVLLFEGEFKKAANKAKEGATQFALAGLTAGKAAVEGYKKGAASEARLGFGVVDPEEIVPDAEDVEETAKENAKGIANTVFREIQAEMQKLDTRPIETDLTLAPNIKLLTGDTLQFKGMAEGFEKVMQEMGVSFTNFTKVFDLFDLKFSNMSDKMKDKFKAIGMGLTGVFQSLNDLFDQNNANQLAKLDAKHQKEMDYIDKTRMSEERKSQLKAVAEKKYQKESEKLKKRQARKDKALAIFNAIIATAAGIAKAVPNPGLMALAGIVGATQVATIAATPIPMANGGILSGPTNILAGEYMGARNNPEIIAPLDKLKTFIGDTNINLQGAFRLTGNDLILAVEQANKNRIRQGGQSIF
jgi:tape measure domain-containing protein